MNNYSKIVLNDYLSFEPPHLALIRAIEAEFYNKYLPFKGKILDVGCGDGFFAWSVFNRQKIDLGIDVNESLWKEAKVRGNYKKVKVYDGYEIPVKDNSFDTVVSNCVLEHVPEVERLVDDMARVTRKGGLVIVTVVTDRFGNEMLGRRIFGNWYKKWFNKKSVHVSNYSKERWIKIFEGSGLKIIEASNYVCDRETVVLHELSHYWGVSNLITRKLFGKWVWGPSKLSNWLWKKYFEIFNRGKGAKIKSPYLFIAAAKLTPGDDRKL